MNKQILYKVADLSDRTPLLDHAEVGVDLVALA
jgi:hypothetical protein